ncbi:MAG TPA: type II toxin-antitoxin system VapC family toxin [Bryobacteraceae bacterium]|jgi:predicted nucleic acid-binding protein|nr:type II toxin-antitoxin system VapC family toxin [Bryobacteraceae bacterium]
MRAVDTNVLVRLLTGDDPSQTVAAEEFVREGVWASTVAVVETIWVLKRYYGISSAEQAKAVEMLLQHENLHLEDSEAVAAALDLFRARPKLGFSDCLILALARHAGHLPLGTFDRDLGRVDGAEHLKG